MENIVYLPSFVKFASQGSGSDFIQSLNGAIVFGGKFLGRSFGANVFCVEGDPVSLVHIWRDLFTLVVVFAHSSFCFFQGIRCFFVYRLEPVSIVFGGGVFGFGMVWVHCSWVETVVYIK